MSESLLKADIFFFITTIAVVLIGILFAVVIVYIVRILNDMRYISGIVRKETDMLAGDLEEFREKVKREGLATPVVSFFSGLFQARNKRSNERKQKRSK